VACLNCKAETEGDYCSNCGQRTSLGRLDMATIIRDLLSFATDSDNRFWSTLRHLMLNPGRVSVTYVDGARQKYLNPFNVYFLSVAAFFAVSVWLGYFSESVASTNAQLQEIVKESDLLTPNIKELVEQTSSFTAVWLKELAIASKPLSAWFFLLLYRNHGRNYPEILTFTLYLGAQNFFLITMIMLLETLFSATVFGGVGFLIWGSYFILSSKAFFAISWPRTFMLALPAFIMDWLALYILAFTFGHLSVLGFV